MRKTLYYLGCILAIMGTAFIIGLVRDFPLHKVSEIDYFILTGYISFFVGIYLVNTNKPEEK